MKTVIADFQCFVFSVFFFSFLICVMKSLKKTLVVSLKLNVVLKSLFKVLTKTFLLQQLFMLISSQLSIKGHSLTRF